MWSCFEGQFFTEKRMFAVENSFLFSRDMLERKSEKLKNAISIQKSKPYCFVRKLHSFHCIVCFLDLKAFGDRKMHFGDKQIHLDDTHKSRRVHNFPSEHSKHNTKHSVY